MVENQGRYVKIASQITGIFVFLYLLLVVTNTSQGFADLPRTGQTTCYETYGTEIPCAGTGQDGEIQSGVAWPNPRFTDNGDATVTDNLTGLMWTKDGNAPGPPECSPATNKTWQGALDYVACLNRNSYLGYTDWRLPNFKELGSLYHAEQSNTATWLNSQGFYYVLQSLNYWSSTSDASRPNYAWVGMWSGRVFNINKSSSSYVWPVRSGQIGLFGSLVIQLPRTGQTTCYDSGGTEIPCAGTGQDGEIQAGVPWPNPRFTDNGDATVTDNLTGLMWTKDGNAPGPVACFPAVTKTWQGALNYVGCLNTNRYLGYTDWRLPNVNELSSLVHAGQSNTVTWLNSQGFYNVFQSSFYWSSTSYAYNPYSAWIVFMWYGNVDFYDKSSSSYYVWPVRSGQVGTLGYSITGTVTESGVGLSGVTMTLSGDASATTTTAVDGTYSFNGLVGTPPFRYMVTPSLGGYTFTPENRWDIIETAYKVVTGVDFSATCVMNTYYRDRDGDGYGGVGYMYTHVGQDTLQACTQPQGYSTNSDDCNDGNASINPGIVEVCNGVDDDCDGPIDEECLGVEVCDYFDNDQDGLIDEGVLNTYYRDADGDGYGNPLVTIQDCSLEQGGYYVENGLDCNDNDNSIDPNADEVPNGVDDNCDSRVDEGCLGVAEVCDGIDNDGDGMIDEDFPAGNTKCGSGSEVAPATDVPRIYFPTVIASGTTTVTTGSTGPVLPGGYSLGAVPVYYEITTTATFKGSAEVCINYNPSIFRAERSLKLFHYENSSWKNITTGIDTAVNTICGLTTSFSPFVVAEESSTAVTLSDISVRMDGDDVLLAWSTRSETENEGFVVLRSANQNGPFSPVSSMIPAVGGLGMKAAYTFTDSNVEDGKTYYYRLQDVDSSGRVTEHKVISAITGGQKPEARSKKQEEGNQKLEARSKMPEARSEASGTEGKVQVSQHVTSVVVVMPDSAHPANSSKGGGDDVVVVKEIPQRDRNLNEAEQLNVNSVAEKQPEKVIVSSTDHSNNLKPPSFSVSLEDEKGNVVKISNSGNDIVTNTVPVTESQQFSITERSGKIVLTWLGKGTLKGFILQRSEKGKDKFTSISGLIPYFGKDANDRFVYEFTDKGADSRNQFDYRLETVTSDKTAEWNPIK